jgi:NAD-dependent deacetylase
MAEVEPGDFDLVLSIGTTSVFPYIAGPVLTGGQRGVPTVEINPGETGISRAVRYKLAMGARDALVALNARLPAA